MARLESPQPITLDIDRVRESLAAHTRTDVGETFELRREREDSGITGYVVRAEFRGMPVAERQKWLHEFFDREFGEESNGISLVLAFTPEEYAEYLEDF